MTKKKTKKKAKKAKKKATKKKPDELAMVVSVQDEIVDQPPRKVGRPSKYSPEYADKLIEHMKRGLSFLSFAAEIGVAESTISLWAEKHPEFSEAKKEGFSKSRNFWEKLILAASAGKLPGANMTGIIFNLKNRFPKQWSDRKDVHMSGNMKLTPGKVDWEYGDDEE